MKMSYRKLALILLFVVLAVVIFGFFVIKTYTTNKEPENKMLIVFYSHTGNAQFVSEQIQAITGADIFELIAVDPYPEDVNATIERAGQEREEGVLPSLAGRIDNLNDYDIIFLGTPNWFGTLSLPMQSFLGSYDLSGKTIVPFITFGGGGIMNTITDLKMLAPNATILEEFGVSRDDVKNSRSDIAQWLERIGIHK